LLLVHRHETPGRDVNLALPKGSARAEKKYDVVADGMEWVCVPVAVDGSSCISGPSHEDRFFPFFAGDGMFHF
jgi:hypothetical protein